LAIGQLDAPAGQLAHDIADMIGADLMAEPARSAMDHDGHRAVLEPERARGTLVVDRLHLLHFEKVVARTEGAELSLPAPPRVHADRVGIGVGEHAVFLAVLEVARPAGAALHRPRRTVAENA